MVFQTGRAGARHSRPCREEARTNSFIDETGRTQNQPYARTPKLSFCREEMLKGRFIPQYIHCKKFDQKRSVQADVDTWQGILISLDRQGNYFYLSRKERIPWITPRP